MPITEEALSCLSRLGDAAQTGETFVVGESVIVRTVTFTTVGTIQRISTMGEQIFLHLWPACSVVETGEFGELFRTGKIRTIEPIVSPVRLNAASIVDVFSWDHPIPK